jgi:N-acetyl-gamma-glutamyl-phosphate reductase
LLALAPLIALGRNASVNERVADTEKHAPSQSRFRRNLLAGKIIVDAKTGSSGSGAKPAANTHHPQRANSFYAYKPFTHQHVPEISQHLKQIGEFENDFVFMSHSLPVSRGIFASCYLELAEEISSGELKEVFSRFYHSKRDGENLSASPNLRVAASRNPFVRLVEGSPDINWVKNTNFCDIAVHASGKHIAVFSALDNLVKGAAGQAVQNMNLMFGLDETTGLIFPGSNP